MTITAPSSFTSKTEIEWILDEVKDANYEARIPFEAYLPSWLGGTNQYERVDREVKVSSAVYERVLNGLSAPEQAERVKEILIAYADQRTQLKALFSAVVQIAKEQGARATTPEKAMQVFQNMDAILLAYEHRGTEDHYLDLMDEFGDVAKELIEAHTINVDDWPHYTAHPKGMSGEQANALRQKRMQAPLSSATKARIQDEFRQIEWNLGRLTFGRRKDFEQPTFKFFTGQHSGRILNEIQTAQYENALIQMVQEKYPSVNITFGEYDEFNAHIHFDKLQSDPFTQSKVDAATDKVYASVQPALNLQIRRAVIAVESHIAQVAKGEAEYGAKVEIADFNPYYGGAADFIIGNDKEPHGYFEKVKAAIESSIPGTKVLGGEGSYRQPPYEQHYQYHIRLG